MIKKHRIFSAVEKPAKKSFSKTKTISYLAIIVAILSIMDQFLDWGIINMLLRMLDS